MNNTLNMPDAHLSGLPNDDSIIGVEFKFLKTFPDARGFFREVLRYNDPIFTKQKFAQWSHSHMRRNVVKAWHYHHRQIDWWYVPLGQIEAVLFDNREESPTYRKKLVFKLGEAKYGKDTYEACVRIPQGVLHGCKVLSAEAHLFYITSETYDPQDEGRIPYDSSTVSHDWGKDALTAENDRKYFTPLFPRPTVR